MKKIIFFFLLVAIVSCSDKELLTPSMAEVDFVRIEDDPSDPLQHLRYSIFEKHNVSLYFNDTLGVETRVNASGGNYLHYFTLKPYFIPGGNNDDFLRYKLYDKEKLPQMVDFVKDLSTDFLEKMPQSLNIRNILIVDTVGNGVTSFDYYQGYNTIVVGSMVERYSETFWEDLRFTLCRSKALSDNDWLIANYYSISNRFYKGTNKFKSYAHVVIETQEDFDGYIVSLGWDYIWKKGFFITPARINNSFTKLSDLGFLVRHYLDPSLKDPSIQEKDWLTPTQKQDLDSYVELLLNNSYAETVAKYEDYPVIMEKYHLLRERFAAFGVVIE